MTDPKPDLSPERIGKLIDLGYLERFYHNGEERVRVTEKGKGELRLKQERSS